MTMTDTGSSNSEPLEPLTQPPNTTTTLTPTNIKETQRQGANSQQVNSAHSTQSQNEQEPPKIEKISHSLQNTNREENQESDRSKSKTMNPTSPTTTTTTTTHQNIPSTSTGSTSSSTKPETESKTHSDEPIIDTKIIEHQPPVPETNSTTDPAQVYLTPQIQELANMFPQIQPTIIEAVLDVHRNDTTACISDLLAMSDPSYKPSEQEVMEKSDEQLARQLASQDNQQSDYSSHPYINHHDHHSNEYQQQQQQAHLTNLPYQPRIKKNPSLNRNSNRLAGAAQPPSQQTFSSVNQDQQATDGKDEIQKIAEEIGKLAETGKKTMTLWFSKAKAKMQEIQQPSHHPPGDSSSSSNSRSRPIDDFEDDYEYVAHRPSSTTSPSASITPNTNSSDSNNSRNTRITPNLPYGSRYQNSTSGGGTATNPSSHSATGTPSLSSKAVKGYTIDDSNSSNLEKLALDDRHRSTLPTTTTTSTNSQQQQHLHPLLLGSKNPSSSVTPSTAAAAHQKIRDDDEESLEYTRNPFEDDD